MAQTQTDDTTNFVASFLFMRRGIGLLGVALPIALPLLYGIFAGQWHLLNSLSRYYYTDTRNVFVGTLCAIGVFLFCYRYKPSDFWVSNIAGLAAITVALCPTTPMCPNDPTVPYCAHATKATGHAMLAGTVHLVAAGILFALLAYFCIFRFGHEYESKRKTLYRICGYVIVAVIVLILITSNTSWLNGTFLAATDSLFWYESIGIFAFGLAWLVEGLRSTSATPSPAAPPPPPGIPTQPAAGAVPEQVNG